MSQPAGARAGIQRQIQLPLSKAFEIALNSIKHRFWRTLITAIGILLGIAFLVSVLSSGIFQEGVVQSFGPRSPQWIAYYDKAAHQETVVREVWLVSLALLVSTLGIMNAMLMSVGERYREIGTMKCLGALDSLIIKIFVVEALMTGVLASGLGAVLGFLVIFLSYLAQQGTKWIHYAEFSRLFLYVLLSFVGGSLLGLFASAWPAAIAAKMPPAEAFRVEV